jgi:2-oxoacid:acceptor oxidoreductase delta subunit (pyruvate/2-ketoisovalerate family)
MRLKMKKDKAGVTIGAVVIKAGSSISNKTGGWRTFKPVRDKEKCIKCMKCWQFCPDACINKEIITDYDYCKGCGICAEVCPVKCIRMIKEEK